MDKMPHERSSRLLYGIQQQRKRERGIFGGEQLPEQEKVMQAAMLEGSIGHFFVGAEEPFINQPLPMKSAFHVGELEAHTWMRTVWDF